MRRWQVFVLRRGKPFTSDQMVLALAAHTDGLPLALLPETCNYISPWRFDPRTGVLVQAWYPYDPVGVVHLAGEKRMRFDPSATIAVPGLDGRSYDLSLRYRRFHEMAKTVVARAAPAGA